MNGINCSVYFASSSKFIQNRFYASKNYIQILKKDTEVHELVSSKTKPRENLLAVFGVAGTGALGIKKMICNERKHGNIITARKPYPLYYFNYGNNIGMSIKNVACGFGFTLFSGRKKPYWQVYGCGLNNDSQIGSQDVTLNDQGHNIIMEPSLISLPGKLERISHIACGRAHSIIVGEIDSADTNTQVIYSLGNNFFGQCGREIIDNEIFFNNNIVHRINLPKRVKQVECGELTTFLLTEDGTIYVCGSNIHGLLANREIQQSSAPVMLRGNIEGEVVKQISCRSNTVLALTERGDVWAWGDNQHNLVFSNPDDSSVTEPRLLKMPPTVGRVVQVSSGNSVCAVVDECGQVHTWGQFLVGHGPSLESCSTPKMIPTGLFGGGLFALDNDASKVVSVHCGIRHCTAITASGCLFFWGEGAVLKHGSQTFPIRMPLTFNAKRAFIGADHSVIMGGTDL